MSIPCVEWINAEMHAEPYIEELAAQGRYHFTTQEALQALGGTDIAVRAQLRRLKEHGRIASPFRSFHVIVPPEYRRLGCLPAEQFIDQLMEMLGESYYVALLSAAERYGAAHQRPQSFHVMVHRNRPPIECGQVRVAFIARGDMEKMPINTFNTPRGVLKYATPEVTALELVGYPNHAGGLSNIASVLAELAESIDPDELLKAAELSPVGWSQRLGYLLEFIGEEKLADELAPFVDKRARSFMLLRRKGKTTGAERNARWKVVVNADVEVDL